LPPTKGNEPYGLKLKTSNSGELMRINQPNTAEPEIIKKGAWTYARVATLKKLWADGLTANQIADRLRNVTGAAVVSKARMLGLPGRPKFNKEFGKKHQTGWTEERTKKAVSLWEKGLSASQIAIRLGGVTRNAVIGKITRLGLQRGGAPRASRPKKRVKPSLPRSKPTSAIDPQQPTLPKTFYTKPETVPLPVAREPELVVPVNERVTILELNDNTCRWPMGDPRDEDLHYCGRPPEAKRPYCLHHTRIAYVPLSLRQAANKRAQQQSRAAYG